MKSLWRVPTRGLRNGHKRISYHKTVFISKQILVDRELKSRYKMKANVAKSSSLVDYCLILNRGGWVTLRQVWGEYSEQEKEKPSNILFS